MGDHVDQGVADADHLVAGRRGCGDGRIRRGHDPARYPLLPYHRPGDCHHGTRSRVSSPGSVPPRQGSDPESLRRRDHPAPRCCLVRRSRVSIAVDIVEPTSRIVLNAVELAITAASVNGAAASWTLDESTERLTLSTVEPVAAGRATIEIGFTGILNDKLRGFYRSTFVDADRDRAGHRDHSDAGHRLPAGVPVLGRARVQGRVRDHARDRPRARPPSRTVPRSAERNERAAPTDGASRSASPTRW